jgi:4-hydroxybenzoate polyprenyltransferase
MFKKQFPNRFAVYLKERFPLQQFIILSIFLGGCASILAQNISQQNYQILKIFLTSAALLFFLFRLRLFDEFKDYKHDKKYYPSRPVPRGLISFNELKILIFTTLIFEIIVSLANGTTSFILYLIALLYSLLLLKELFINNWLRKHFTTYIAVHEILAFFLIFYLFSLNVKNLEQILNLNYLLYSIFLVSILFSLEVARKIRPRNLEIASKDTYTAQYGIKNASRLLIFIASFGFLSLAVTLYKINMFTVWTFLPNLIILIFLIKSLNNFQNSPIKKSSARVFLSTAVYAIMLLLNASFNLWLSK